MTPPRIRPDDLRGAARLAAEAVAGVTSVVEAMHARIARIPRLPWSPLAPAAPDRTQGITRWVYAAVRGVTHAVGDGAEALLAGLGPLLATPAVDEPPHPRREAVLAALNGVLGDHLAATGNPLAISMALRQRGVPLPQERRALRQRLHGATPRLLLLLHGLCMNDLQWRRAGRDHAEALAHELGYTPVHLHYNTGLGIAENGRQLARLMQGLVGAWPLPLERVTMLGHSMGGLVARSALHQGRGDSPSARGWPARVDALVCLGSPHLGAPLERAGHGIDLLLGAAPFAAPLARLGRIRSAGINDLRHGTIVAAPPGGERTQRTTTVPLPSGIRCFAVAASLGPAHGSVKSRLLGDGLVPVASALGQHRDPRRRLDFPPTQRAVVHETGHLDLLSSPQVTALLCRWLA